MSVYVQDNVCTEPEDDKLHIHPNTCTRTNTHTYTNYSTMPNTEIMYETLMKGGRKEERNDIITIEYYTT